MTVTAVRKDLDALTMTLDAEFEAPPERVWQLWADPRQLERWWGPPTYPATVTAHDLRTGDDLQLALVGRDRDQDRPLLVPRPAVQLLGRGPDRLVQIAQVDAEAQTGRLVGDPQRLVEAEELPGRERTVRRLLQWGDLTNCHLRLL